MNYEKAEDSTEGLRGYRWKAFTAKQKKRLCPMPLIVLVTQVYASFSYTQEACHTKAYVHAGKLPLEFTLHCISRSSPRGGWCGIFNPPAANRSLSLLFLTGANHMVPLMGYFNGRSGHGYYTPLHLTFHRESGTVFKRKTGLILF